MRTLNILDSNSTGFTLEYALRYASTTTPAWFPYLSAARFFISSSLIDHHPRLVPVPLRGPLLHLVLAHRLERCVVHAGRLFVQNRADDHGHVRGNVRRVGVKWMAGNDLAVHHRAEAKARHRSARGRHSGAA